MTLGTMKLAVQQPGVREIKVKLLLAGGQSAMLVVPPEHPLLAQLLATVATRGDAADNPAVFQIPLEGGRTSLAFAAHQLVGVITDPAVLMQSEPAAKEKAAPALVSAATAAAPAASAAQGQGGPIRHPIVQLDEFLSGAEVAWLLELVSAAESRFVPSTVSDGKADYRQSLALPAPDELRRVMLGKITAAMPEVMPQLRMGKFPLGAIDCQVTASVDGSFFKVHTDAGRNETYKRQFTYVYYFNREPKAFTGGELRIYDDTVRNGKLAATDSFQTVAPRHNSIVFFQAAVMHEVLPVSVASKQFRDARFTVNGWIERA